MTHRSLDAGQLRSLRMVADHKWEKLTDHRQAELVELGLVQIDDYGSPEILPAGTHILKENT